MQQFKSIVCRSTLIATIGFTTAAQAGVGADFDHDGHDDLAIGAPYETVGTATYAGAMNIIYGREDGLQSPGDQFWHADKEGIASDPQTYDLFGFAIAHGDFDGDDFDDVAVTAYLKLVGSTVYAGAVHVLYGSNSGIAANGDQLWHQDKTDIPGDPVSYDYFGYSLATGDFDSDGYDDLAIGIPYDTVGTARAGAVQILYGTVNGLKSDGNQLWNQNSPGIEGVAEEGDFFGASLAIADFNTDGYDDLAIGATGEAVGAVVGAGAVNIIYGGSNGLTSLGNTMFHQDVAALNETEEAYDNFGQSLAAGDFDHDGDDDLAIGVPNEDVGAIVNAGLVHVLYGSNSGLVAGSQQWHQDKSGIEDQCETNDQFGTSLAAGDFNEDGRFDLAVGIPYEDIGAVNAAGAIAVLYGSNTGLRNVGNQFFHQDSNDVIDVAETEDIFGFALAAGDFNGDGRDDLAIGAPGEDKGPIANAGIVHVLYGRHSGLRALDNQVWHQDRAGISNACEDTDYFGYSLGR